MPHQNELLGAAPNPVTSSTEVAYLIAQAGEAELAIFDVTGRKVGSLANEAAAPGSCRAQWARREDGGYGAASGICFA